MKSDCDKSADDTTVGQLYDFITSEGFSPGDKLPVRKELERKTGIGPRRLREALRVLEHQGLLESRNKGGTVVRKTSPEKLAEPAGWCLDACGATEEHLLRARACIEGAAVFEATRTKTARDLLNILDALEKLEAKQKQKQADWQEEREFHLAILKATHNPAMLMFERVITLNLERNQAAGIAEDHSDMIESNRQHRRIFQAMQDNDPARAMTLMYEHIMKT